MTDPAFQRLLDRASEALPPPVLEYVLQGSGDGLSAQDAPRAWSQMRLRPRVLTDVTRVDLRTELPGPSQALCFGVAPTTLQGHVHPQGEVAMARACHAAGQVMVVSSNAGRPFAEIGETGVDWWLQAYLPQRRELALPLLHRAVAAGASAIVLTADTPVVGTKRNAAEPVWDLVDPGSQRVNFDAGNDEAVADKARDLSPADIAWLAETAGLPVVVKGVLRGDDAATALEAGAAAVWVSNHGGRQLDRAISTAAALPEVRAGVGDDATVLVDGGIRSGLDVLTALACGADAVFAGRPPLLALVDGEAGVRAWQQRWTTELTEAMRLAGVNSPSEVRRADLIG